MIALNIILAALELLTLIYGIWYFMSHMERNIKRPWWCYLLVFIIYGIVLLTISLVVRDDRVSIGTGLLITMGIGHSMYNSRWQYLFYYIFYMVCIFLCQSAVIFSVRVILMPAGVQNVLIYGNMAIMIKILVVLSVTILLVYLFRKKAKVELTKWQFATMFLLPVFSLIFLFSLLILSTVYIQLYGLGLIALNFFMLLLLNFYFIYLFGYMFKANHLEQKLLVFQKQNEIQYRYYGDLEKKYQESRKMIHDMKNHLKSVERLYEEEEREAAKTYVKDIYHILNVLGEKYYTDNKMLNIILNDKLGKAEREGIKVYIAVGNIELEKIKDLDITTIFANLLDNAIEAAIGVKTDAWIRIKIDCVHEFIVCRISNSMEPSGKKGEGHMGLGMVNVTNTLERYHGTMQIEQLENEYQVNLTIPK